MAQGRKAGRPKGDPVGRKKWAWNDGPHFGALYLHEAMYMASYFSRAVEEELVEHPAVKNDPELAALAETAREALGELYQKVAQAGSRAMEKMEAEERDKS